MVKCDFTKRELQIITNVLKVDDIMEMYLPKYACDERKKIIKKANKLRGRDNLNSNKTPKEFCKDKERNWVYALNGDD